MSLLKSSSYFSGIRFRLTLVYSTLFGLFICIFAFIITEQHTDLLRKDFDSALINYAIDLSDAVQIDSSNFKVALQLPYSESKKVFPFVPVQTFYKIRDIDGNILKRSHTGQFPPIPYNKEIALKEDYTHRFQSMLVNGIAYRSVNLKITNKEGISMILQLATPSTILDDQESRYIITNALTIPFLILLSGFVSFILAGNALNPVRTLTETANNIVAKNLSLRVPETDSRDEIGELSKTFNNLLARLEQSFKAQENFVANASHQLNTPLSIIKGELDVLESKVRSPEEIQRFQHSLREELERLIELVKNMLLVSRVEAGQESFVFHPVRVDEILLSTTSRLATKARDKKIQLRFNISSDVESDSLMVNGEKQLLDCLFENLLENAIKYSPDESTILLDLKTSLHELEVWIEDQGPGIPSEDLEKILTERFRRGSKVTHPGIGIGLSIAYQIAEFHGAKIIYERISPHGSRFVVKFSK